MYSTTAGDFRCLLYTSGDKALKLGPHALSRVEKMELLSDPAGLHDLHKKVWELDDGPKAAAWGVCPDNGENESA